MNTKGGRGGSGGRGKNREVVWQKNVGQEWQIFGGWVPKFFYGELENILELIWDFGLGAKNLEVGW